MLQATVRAARHFVLGEAAAVGAVSTATTTLVKQALRTMMIAKLKMAGAAALGVGVLAFVVSGLAAMVAAAPEGISAPSISNADDRLSPAQASTPPAPASRRRRPRRRRYLTFHGRVLGPDGRPAAGAAIYTVFPSVRRPDRAGLESENRH